MMKNPHPAKRRVMILLGVFGAFLLLFGAVTLGTNLKDHNGPGISSGAWAMAGGVLIIAVATYFGTLTVG